MVAAARSSSTARFISERARSFAVVCRFCWAALEPNRSKELRIAKSTMIESDITTNSSTSVNPS